MEKPVTEKNGCSISPFGFTVVSLARKLSISET